MKRCIILLTLSIIYSCGSYVQPQKQSYSKTGQYESGNRSDGVVYMSVVYQPQKENPPTLNIPATEESASRICSNWGYTGIAKFEGGDTQGQCIHFNYNNGSCITMKIPFKVICQ